ncbi:MAG TPA: diacylglycerol kinase family protein [Caulobacteraceae bacterium]|jgi:diacylglycerol kinase family enzyme
MPATNPSASDVLQERLVAILNTASGSFTPQAPSEVRSIFDGSGLPHGEVICASPAELDGVLDEAMERADVLVVLGGDGTIRTAAEKSGHSGNVLIPLPGGTMNLLPRALYGARGWREALSDTLASPKLHSISGGRAGPLSFYVAAVVGAPTLWADAREAVRERRFIEALRRAATAVRRHVSEPLNYVFDGRLTGSAEAVAVMCPLVSKVMNEDEEMLEAAAIDTRSAGEMLRLGVNTLLDNWRNDPAVVRAKVRKVVVTGHGRIPLTVDGELMRLGRRVEIEFIPLAFRSLVPSESGQPPKV